jgi:hypothetical protein
MSAAVPVPLRKVLVVDPLCDQSVESVFAIEKSASIQNFYNISSTNKSSSSISWTVNCNSENTITDRVWLLDVTGTFTIPYNAKVTVADSIALRPNALSLCATSIVLQQGNSSSSIQSSQIASALQRYGFYDKYLNYSEANPDLDMTTPYVAGEGVFSPLSKLVGGKYQGRIGTSGITGAVWNGSTLSLTVRFLEPVLIPPLLSGLEQRKEGLRRISQYQLTYNFGAFERAFSVVFEDNAHYINGKIGATFGDCRLNLLQVIPSPLDVGRSLSVQSLPYDEFVAFVSDTANLAVSPVNAIVGGTAQFSSSVIQVSRIPEAIYIYCRPTDAFLSATGGSYLTDTFAQYVSNSLSVNFNGVNQFQNCSDISLYRICRQNGLNTPWTQFNCSGISSLTYQANPPVITYDSGVGAVICLKLSKDITLDASLAPSVNTKVNMQIQCTFGNPYSKIAENNNPYNVDSIPFAMYTVVHYSGVQETYASNTVATTIGALTVDDVLTATKRNERVHYDVIDDNVFGGASFLDKAKKFLKEGRLANALKQLKSYFSHPLTKEIGKTAKEYLRGREGAEEGSSQAADFIEELGLGMSGGRKMTKAQLKRALL